MSIFATADYLAATIVPFPSWDATIQGLKNGKVDAVDRDEFEIRTVLIEDPALHIGFGGAVLSDRTSFPGGGGVRHLREAQGIH